MPWPENPALTGLRDRTAVLLHEDADREHRRWREAILAGVRAAIIAGESSGSVSARDALRDYL